MRVLVCGLHWSMWEWSLQASAWEGVCGQGEACEVDEEPVSLQAGSPRCPAVDGHRMEA